MYIKFINTHFMGGGQNILTPPPPIFLNGGGVRYPRPPSDALVCVSSCYPIG